MWLVIFENVNINVEGYYYVEPLKSGGPFNSVKHLEVIYPYHFRENEDCPSKYVYKFFFYLNFYVMVLLSRTYKIDL